MTTITINNEVFHIHPVYDLYAASEDENIINIIKRVPNKGKKGGCGYLKLMVRRHGQSSQKTYYAHRFIWEVFNGNIPPGLEVDHINNKRDDNRLSNLQVLTPKENCKKTADNLEPSYFSQKTKNRRCLKATNKNTNKESYYYSIYAAGQHLEINNSCIWKICEKMVRFSISKKDGHLYTFEYIKEEDLPKNHIKSANKRPRKASDEEIRKRKHDWWNKEYICPNCGFTTKNNSKYKHKKRCSIQK